MNAGQIVTQMNQQLSVIKNLEELLAHDAKEKGAHEVKSENVTALKKYVAEMRLAFEAGAMAGELISQGTGLAFAQMSDPLRGVNSGVVGQWFYLAFGLLFFTANGHLALVSLLVDSYRSLPIGTALPDVQQMLEVAPMLFGHVLRAAVGLALPVMVAMLAVNLAFGVLGRAAPALNPIQLGLPTALLLGLFLLALLAGELGPPVQRVFDLSFDAARQITG